ncbi:Aste57867_10955 [Aphanomyces stellatus]|uniref:Aste57867_10955 protein n=1 Tax=Aphanomyces stellatus TaxID=120398 RepID=A0A485KSV7_9STRA|nr:hypothetical protein As57867_010915 [Aphanomyces stellatus]VFT87823.1 Aste57867_10955 [Aphanomyces stellatus]
MQQHWGRRWLSTTLREARRRLVQRGIVSTELNAILAHVFHPPLSREMIFMQPDMPMTTTHSHILDEMSARRLAGEPLAYILGEKDFWSLPFKVTPETLIPRPETELLIDLVLSLHNDKNATFRLLDIGTGSGCLVVAALTEFPNATGVAIDISTGALAVAEENAARHGVTKRVNFLEQDMRTLPVNNLGCHALFDVVLCNPPYIARTDTAAMDAHVLAYEPHSALFADDDGLALYKHLREPLAVMVRPGGHVLFEVGYQQARHVRDWYLASDAYQPSEKLKETIVPDLQGHDRVVALQLAPRDIGGGIVVIN